MSQASVGGTGISSQRAAVPTGTIQQEGIPPQMPELSTHSELTLTFMESCSLKNTSAHLTRWLFSEQIHITSNTTGHKNTHLQLHGLKTFNLFICSCRPRYRHNWVLKLSFYTSSSRPDPLYIYIL